LVWRTTHRYHQAAVEEAANKQKEVKVEQTQIDQEGQLCH
jgi:hypothetical protein